MNAAKRAASPPNPWESLGPHQRQALSAIACKTLHLQTMETRNSDRLDFPEVAVWKVREAMALAFLEGRQRRKR